MSNNFANPYGFIPLKHTEKTNAGDCSTEKKLTGYIDYTVLTKTPLFIPNTSNDTYLVDEGDKKEKNEKYHHSYDFFSYSDLSQENAYDNAPEHACVPVIPGSSMRGVLRSYYEILTNSCLSAIDKDAELSRRSAERFKPGLLKKTDGGYTLHPVKEDNLFRAQDGKEFDLGVTQAELTRGYWNKNNPTPPDKWIRQSFGRPSPREGEEIHFNQIERRITIGTGRTRSIKPLVSDLASGNTVGYVLKGEQGPIPLNGVYRPENKHCLHVFSGPDDQPLRENGRAVQISEEYIRTGLLRLIQIYQNNSTNKVNPPYKEYVEQLKAFLNGNLVLTNGEPQLFFPVYYSVLFPNEPLLDKGNLLLSPACITRELYQITISEMLPGYTPCEYTDNCTCPACSLFGTLRSGTQKSITSRVRVTDLRGTKDSYADAMVTLPVLSTPKLSPEMYLNRPDEDSVYWTYAYSVSSNGNIARKDGRINGRKFYWHKLDNCFTSEEQSELNRTVWPVKANQSFEGRIYFDKVTEKELNTLIVLLEANESDKKVENKAHGYKLGEAKPYGFGSIAMKTDKVVVITHKLTHDGIISEEEAYNPDSEETWVDRDVLEDFSRMTDFDAIKEQALKLSYPRVPGKEEIYEWFKDNHTGWSFSRSHNRNERKDFPDDRKHMLFAQYLKPIEYQPSVNTEALRQMGMIEEPQRQTGMTQKHPQETQQVYKTGKIKNVMSWAKGIGGYIDVDGEAEDARYFASDIQNYNGTGSLNQRRVRFRIQIYQDKRQAKEIELLGD